MTMDFSISVVSNVNHAELICLVTEGFTDTNVQLDSSNDCHNYTDWLLWWLSKGQLSRWNKENGNGILVKIKQINRLWNPHHPHSPEAAKAAKYSSSSLSSKASENSPVFTPLIYE